MELLKRIRRLANAAPLSAAELELQAGDWTDVLLDVVPLDWLPDLYKRAVLNHPNSYLVNAFDILQEFKNRRLEIESEKERSRVTELNRTPITRCTQRKHHINEQGETVALNHHTEKDEAIPCPHCRAADHTKWKADQIARYGIIKRPPLTPHEAVEKITRVSEVYLSLTEAQPIADEYNALVKNLVDAETARNLFIKFDEGINRFKHPHRADILFTADDIKEKIDRYKNLSGA